MDIYTEMTPVVDKLAANYRLKQGPGDVGQSKLGLQSSIAHKTACANQI
jgi:hypothetical protein